MTNIVLSALVKAIILWEGRGAERNVTNAAEQAVGVAQIRPCVVADLRAWGYPFRLSDRAHPHMARSMAAMYLTRYVRQAERRAGRPLTVHEAARIWCGGPDGWRTDWKAHGEYAAGVESYYQKGQQK